MNLEAVLKSLLRVGLSISEETVLITDEPKFPSFWALPSKKSQEDNYFTPFFGQALDTNKTLAEVRATAEFLERLCLYNPDKKKFICSGYEPNTNFIDPCLFDCYSEEQVKDRNGLPIALRENTYQWFPAKNIIKNQKIFLPAQLIFLSSDFDTETRIRGESISTGTALGLKSTASAFSTGLLETIERDACISAYLLKKEIKKVVNFPTRIQNLIDYLGRYQLETYIFDITTDLQIPSVLAIVLDRSGIGAAVNIGSKSHYSYKKAVEYAILESIQCRRVARISGNVDDRNLPTEKEIYSIDQRYDYWSPLQRIQDINSWINTNRTVDYTKLRFSNTKQSEALKNIKEKGYNIFVADITLPFLKRAGFEVLKVIIPELHPLYLDERAKMLHSVHYGDIPNDSHLKPHFFT